MEEINEIDHNYLLCKDLFKLLKFFSKKWV